MLSGVDKLPSGIFGQTLSGKSTLARKLVLEYEGQGMRAIVLDPHREKWGKHSIVFGANTPEAMESEERKFWEMVWASRHCVIVCEEAAATLRRDRELIPAFTRIRHNFHKLIVCGHGGADLLPTMRNQLGTVFLFQMDEDSAKFWARRFADKELLATQFLNQYEYIQKVSFQRARKRKLSL